MMTYQKERLRLPCKSLLLVACIALSGSGLVLAQAVNDETALTSEQSLVERDKAPGVRQQVSTYPDPLAERKAPGVRQVVVPTQQDKNSHPASEEVDHEAALPSLPPTFYTLDGYLARGSEAAQRLERYEQLATTHAGFSIQLVDAELARRPSIAFQLPDGRTLRLLRDHITYRSAKDYSWYGHVEHDYGIAVFVVREGLVTAQVQVGGEQYKIRPLGNDEHALFEEVPTAYPGADGAAIADDSELAPNDHGHQKDPEASARASQINCAVRVLVAYSDDVAAAHADPRGEIQLATDFFNVATTTSFVAHDIELARVIQLPYTEPSSGVNSSTALAQLRSSTDGVWDEVHSLRALYDADVVVGIFEDIDGGCGRGYVGPGVNASYNVNDYGCIAGNLTYAHEIGHNYGALHDVFVDPSPGSDHGYAYPPGGWRTIMAYNNACSAAGTSCTRLQFWSNPDRNHLGNPTGVPGESDVESTLDNNYATMAAIQGTPTNKMHYTGDTIFNNEEANHYGGATLTNTANLMYQSGAIGRMEAPDAITLADGFWAKQGSVVTARNRDCAVTGASRPSNFAARSQVVAEKPRTLPVEARGRTDLRVFPNPVRNRQPVTIDFTLAEEGFASVEVYDATGRHVETVSYLPTHAVGNHVLSWTSARLSAGTYSVVLRTATGQVSRKLQVID